MTTRDCTATSADLENKPYLYPVISSTNVLHVHEDKDEYNKKPANKASKKNENNHKQKTMQINCKALQRHIEKRMKAHQHMLPIRLHQTLDDLNLFLAKQSNIDLYDLLIEFNLMTDEQPAKEMIALMAALDANALIELKEHDIMNAASFIRDTMDYNLVRWVLDDEKKERK